MTEEAKTAEATTTTPPPATPPAQTVDVEKLVNDRIKAVEESTLKKVTQKIVKTLSGEPEEKQLDPIQKAFIEAPQELIRSIQEQTEAKVMEKINARDSLREEYNRTMTPLLEDYPDLKRVPNEIYAEFSAQDTNEPISARLKKAADKVVERMGYKKVSDAERQAAIRNAALAPTGTGGNFESSTTPSPAKIIADSAKDYFKGRKQAFEKVRTMQTAK